MLSDDSQTNERELASVEGEISPRTVALGTEKDMDSTVQEFFNKIMALQITSPAPNEIFTITAEPAWPTIQFQTNTSLSPGQKLKWSWKIQWDKFIKQGEDQSITSSWSAQSAIFQTLSVGVITNLGGKLTVQVTGTGGAAHITVQIKGTNPTRADVIQFLSQQPNSDGFERILDQESGMKHFKPNGEPIKSRDNGYGMAQLTNPSPSYEQVWNWKLNIATGLKLFGSKRGDATKYLSQNGRSFTDDQLIRETLSLWNGGHYHVWNGHNWVRNPNILCDRSTGNIGWDMRDTTNAGLTQAQLHNRDASKYGGVIPKPDDHWNHFGVCYADHLYPPSPPSTPLPLSVLHPAKAENDWAGPGFFRVAGPLGVNPPLGGRLPPSSPDSRKSA